MRWMGKTGRKRSDFHEKESPTMVKSWKQSILPTDKRIRMGIWGLGRGLNFYRTCGYLNIDVVAGCDYNKHMRERFLRDVPGARATADEDEFLSWDFDAVLLATYCPNHAGDAIKCLQAGKHVLSEVTSFHTMAEGVELVEEVERSGLIYNLAENYPFSAANMWLARKWKEGVFGELMYGEYEYVHECRSLAYTYIDGVPVIPGWALHNWRSWINFHYYNTHSLGPMMIITGRRPTRVVSLMGEQKLPGYPLKPPEGMGSIAPSLINMDNGSVVRNLMGATTNDTHMQRLWGTKGASEIVDGKLRVRLGGGGGSPRLEVEPKWDDLGELAAQTGHGGGDFWVLYYFARQIFFGDPGPFDIYGASDCTIPGILAYRSSRENGKPYDVPDFRDRKQRRKWRNDHFGCPRLDPETAAFPKRADPRIVGKFSTVISRLIRYSLLHRAYADWSGIAEDVKDLDPVIDLAEQIIGKYPEMRKTMRAARKIADAYPRSEGSRVLRDMLEHADEEKTMKRGFVDAVKKDRTRLKRMQRSKSRKK